MYSVTKRIDFCYGHRLVGHDGVCKHLHGHNAIAEIEVRADTLDSRDMVVDFGDIKRLVKEWIDREAEALQALGEPVYLLDSNPTAERIARLLFDVSRERGLAVSRVTLWETPSSWATYAG
jgi:6-pyruvoyltetrahydropterin/6-carboxytetrahydropterin synthase